MTGAEEGFPHTRVRWRPYYRLINSAYPPIDLFEDIADPEDWALLGQAEARTNPRAAETIGQLDLVPPARRVGGPGASYVMAPFTHCSPDRPGRFHTGHFGAFYGARELETAVAETVHHIGLFLKATAEAPGWVADLREVTGALDADLLDLRSDAPGDLLDPGDYAASHAFAVRMRERREDGIVYPSVRNPGGECFAAFWPDVMGVPVQTRHFGYHWDGTRIDLLRQVTGDGAGPVYRLTDEGSA